MKLKILWSQFELLLRYFFLDCYVFSCCICFVYFDMWWGWVLLIAFDKESQEKHVCIGYI